jgi:pilus assembly protein CpaB
MALAGAAGLLAVLFTLRAGVPSGEGGWVLVAREPIPAGTAIDAELAAEALESVAVPGTLPLAGLFTSADAVLGGRTVAHLGAGEPVTAAVLGGAPGTGPAPLAAGERAVTAPLSAAAAASVALAPGVRVDVVASTGEGPSGRTTIIVGDAEVLSVSPAGPAGDGGEAILRVSAEEALTVTAALNFAREVRLLVRPFDEPGHFGGPDEVAAP